MGVLVVSVLLLVVVPALLYLVGWGSARLSKKIRAKIGSRIPRREPIGKARGDASTRTRL